MREKRNFAGVAGFHRMRERRGDMVRSSRLARDGSPLSGVNLLYSNTPMLSLHVLVAAEKHFDLALGRWFQKAILKLCPQFCPQSQRMRRRSRLAISDTDQGGRQRPSVYASLGVFGACLMIACLGQGAKRVVGLHRVRADLSLQLDRSLNPGGWSV